ncbi:MAG: pilus assembly protein TadG-related protein [Planctomycetota bacterium]|jgi:hypothetical protein
MFRQSNKHQRRGVVAVITVVLLAVLMGFAALTVDVGAAYNTKSDLQDAADAAALAAAAAYTTDNMMQVRLDTQSAIYSVISEGATDATSMANENPSFGTRSTIIGGQDIAFGWLDLVSASSALNSGVVPSAFNAVQVTAKRTADSVNGPVSAIFSQIFGNSTMDIQATATASFDDRVAGYDTNFIADLIPVSIHEDRYNSYLTSGPDNFTFDTASATVAARSDGIREMRLFPGWGAPGNYGLLNINNDSQSEVEVRAQIENGVPPEDFEAETGSEVLTFWDGSQQTYNIGGDPGMKSSLESAVEPRVGQIIGHFVHDEVVRQGATSSFRITRIAFGRIMYVDLSEQPTARGIEIQPVIQSGGGIILSADAPSSGGMVGRLVLSR